MKAAFEGHGVVGVGMVGKAGHIKRGDLRGKGALQESERP